MKNEILTSQRHTSFGASRAAAAFPARGAALILLVFAGCRAEYAGLDDDSLESRDGGDSDADVAQDADDATPTRANTGSEGRGTAGKDAADTGDTRGGGKGTAGSDASPSPASAGASASNAGAGASGAGGASSDASSAGRPTSAGSGGAPPGGAAAAAPAAGGGGAPAAVGAIDCTRDGLARLVDTYFEALAAHDPGRVPFAASVKLTENARTVAPGDSLWKAAGALHLSRSALDTQSCATFTEAVIDNQGSAIIVGVRLRLEAQQVTEVETYIAESWAMPQGLLSTSGKEWEVILPQAQRNTREQLSATADAYFDNLGDPQRSAPFGMPCDAMTNGVGQGQFDDVARDLGATPQHTCGSVLLPVIPGLPNINASPTHRRVPVIDVETGIVVALGLVADGTLNGAMLKVIEGKIRFIDSVAGPAVMSPGWD